MINGKAGFPDIANLMGTLERAYVQYVCGPLQYFHGMTLVSKDSVSTLFVYFLYLHPPLRLVDNGIDMQYHRTRIQLGYCTSAPLRLIKNNERFPEHSATEREREMPDTVMTKIRLFYFVCFSTPRSSLLCEVSLNLERSILKIKQLISTVVV